MSKEKWFIYCVEDCEFEAFDSEEECINALNEFKGNAEAYGENTTIYYGKVPYVTEYIVPSPVGTWVTND